MEERPAQQKRYEFIEDTPSSWPCWTLWVWFWVWLWVELREGAVDGRDQSSQLVERRLEVVLNTMQLR